MSKNNATFHLSNMVIILKILSFTFFGGGGCTFPSRSRETRNGMDLEFTPVYASTKTVSFLCYLLQNYGFTKEIYTSDTR